MCHDDDQLSLSFLRMVKAKLSVRLRQLTLMSQDDLLREHATMSPPFDTPVDQLTTTEMVNDIMQRVIDEALPTHLIS